MKFWTFMDRVGDLAGVVATVAFIAMTVFLVVALATGGENKSRHGPDAGAVGATGSVIANPTPARVYVRGTPPMSLPRVAVYEPCYCLCEKEAGR